jgi:hypothetical protein
VGLDFQKVQGHVRVRFQVEIHRALARAGLVVTITVWKPLLTLQHVHRRTSRVECGYLHRNKPLVVKPAKMELKAVDVIGGTRWVVVPVKKAPGVKVGCYILPFWCFAIPYGQTPWDGDLESGEEVT